MVRIVDNAMLTQPGHAAPHPPAMPRWHAPGRSLRRPWRWRSRLRAWLWPKFRKPPPHRSRIRVSIGAPWAPSRRRDRNMPNFARPPRRLGVVATRTTPSRLSCTATRSNGADLPAACRGRARSPERGRAISRYYIRTGRLLLRMDRMGGANGRIVDTLGRNTLPRRDRRAGMRRQGRAPIARLATIRTMAHSFRVLMPAFWRFGSDAKVLSEFILLSVNCVDGPAGIVRWPYAVGSRQRARMDLISRISSSAMRRAARQMARRSGTSCEIDRGSVIGGDTLLKRLGGIIHMRFVREMLRRGVGQEIFHRRRRLIQLPPESPGSGMGRKADLVDDEGRDVPEIPIFILFVPHEPDTLTIVLVEQFEIGPWMGRGFRAHGQRGNDEVCDRMRGPSRTAPSTPGSIEPDRAVEADMLRHGLKTFPDILLLYPIMDRRSPQPTRCSGRDPADMKLQMASRTGSRPRPADMLHGRMRRRVQGAAERNREGTICPEKPAPEPHARLIHGDARVAQIMRMRRWRSADTSIVNLRRGALRRSGKHP